MFKEQRGARVATAEWAMRESGRCLSDMGRGLEAVLRTLGFPLGQRGNQWRILNRGQL